MTAAPPIGTAGTAGDGYKVTPTIPVPRHGDDPEEPGRRRETATQQRRQR